MTANGQEPASAFVDVRNVAKRFLHRGVQTVALEGVSLQAGRGEFVAVIGPSGCGKSTLLRLVSGLLDPDDGTIEVDGTPPERARAQRMFGMVFQDANLLPWRNLRRNVALPLEIARQRDARKSPRVEGLIDLVGLREFRDHMPHQLSGGMRQRVAIARALVLEPQILLLDEPFGALDDITRQRLNFDLLRILGEQNATALLVTHNISEAVLLADRVVVMSARPGCVKRVIEIDLERPRTRETFKDPRCIDLIARTSDALFEDAGALRSREAELSGG